MNPTSDPLLQSLAALGCGIKVVDHTTLITLPGDDGEFVYEQMGEWLYLGTTFMAPEEFEDSEFSAQLDRFLLQLQHRNLGCRFSYDSAGFLTIGGELGQQQQSAQEVMQMLEQILFIIDSCIHLCDKVLDSGDIPGDREVDDAFGVNEALH